MEENKINAPETVGSPSEEPTSSAPCPLNAPVSRGKKVGTFIVFGFAVLFFVIFCASSIFTLSLLLGKIDDLGEAIGAIFAIILSLPAVIISAFPTLILNILSVVFFKRIKSRETEHPILYKTFHIISFVILGIAVALGILDAIIFLR